MKTFQKPISGLTESLSESTNRLIKIRDQIKAEIADLESKGLVQNTWEMKKTLEQIEQQLADIQYQSLEG